MDIGRWPIFNVADSSIVTGGIVLAWIMFTTKENKVKAEDDAGEGVDALEDTYVAHDQPESN